jgi:hypothetical protein
LSASTLAAVSSLWTPDGERRVREQPQAEPPAEGYDEEQMREVAHEILMTPVEDVVANHCYGLFELAALHLSQQPPSLPAARVAIDAMGYLVDGLGERLGTHGPTLAEGLNQLRLAFVAISEGPPPPEGGSL